MNILARGNFGRRLPPRLALLVIAGLTVVLWTAVGLAAGFVYLGVTLARLL